MIIGNNEYAMLWMSKSPHSGFTVASTHLASIFSNAYGVSGSGLRGGLKTCAAACFQHLCA